MPLRKRTVMLEVLVRSLEVLPQRGLHAGSGPGTQVIRHLRVHIRGPALAQPTLDGLHFLWFNIIAFKTSSENNAVTKFI